MKVSFQEGGQLERWVRYACLASIAVISIVVLVEQLRAFAPLLAGPVRIENEFLQVPDQTVLSTGTVDSLEFIRAHGLGQARFRPDAGDPAPELSLPPAANPQRLLSSGLGYLHYDPTTRRLSMDQVPSQKDRELLLALYTDDRPTQVSLNEFFGQIDRYASSSVDPEVKEFVKANPDFFEKVMSRWFFHHQSYLFFPIQRTELSGDPADLKSQYGFVMTATVWALLKLSGSVTFESYLHLTWAFYLIYALLIGSCIFWLFRKTDYWYFGFVAMVLALVSNEMLGFFPIEFAPGFNPLRHLPDVLLVLMVFGQFRRKTLVSCALASFAIAFCVVWNREMGLAALIANLVASFIDIVVERGESGIRMKVLRGILAFLPLLTLFILPEGPVDLSGLDVILGIGAPQTSWVQMGLFATLLALLSLPLWLAPRGGSRYTAFYLFLWIEGCISGVYFVWNPLPHHFWTFIGSNIPLFVFFVVFFVDRWCLLARPRKLCVSFVGLIVCVVVVAFPLVAKRHASGSPMEATIFRNQFSKELSAFESNFQSHVVYQHRYPRANFESPMDPAFIKRDIDLIQKYTKDERRFTLLSVYDGLYPLLADKYNDIPYISAPLNLNTNTKKRALVAWVIAKRPQYIFADRSLDGFDRADFPSPADPVWGYLGGSAGDRFAVFDAFRQTVAEVLVNYEKVEDGSLLSVYRRRP